MDIEITKSDHVLPTEMWKYLRKSGRRLLPRIIQSLLQGAVKQWPASVVPSPTIDCFLNM